jgi:hypothetical protein
MELGQEEQGIITHGICRDCAYHLFAQIGMPLLEYLDGLNVPVVIVDGDGTVTTANEQARTVLQKDLSEIEGYKGGDVFECSHAKLPEGCGQTIHCSGCTIRKAVTYTSQTGQSCQSVPAVLNRDTVDGVTEARFLISTQKVRDVVLLRIDAAGDLIFS